MPELEAGCHLREYRLLADFSVGAGGNCRYAPAERKGQRYFVKQFLSPKYPLDTSPGTPEGRARRRAAFAAFERYQTEKLAAIRKVAAEDGRLVVPVDQFRHGTFWYTVSPWIDTTGITLARIASQDLDTKLLVLAAVAVALRALHAAGIVHGDLQPDNILLSRTEVGQFRARLIDFDSSYFERRPPEPELVMGSPPYYSPELLSYIQKRGSAAAVTARSDVFALGLVFCQYLSGALPRARTSSAYAAEAVRAGEAVHLAGDALDPRLAPLLRDMLADEAERRPLVRHVYDRVRDALARSGPAPRPDPLRPGPPPSPPAPAPPSRLRIKTKRREP